MLILFESKIFILIISLKMKYVRFFYISLSLTLLPIFITHLLTALLDILSNNSKY